MLFTTIPGYMDTQAITDELVEHGIRRNDIRTAGETVTVIRTLTRKEQRELSALIRETT